MDLEVAVSFLVSGPRCASSNCHLIPRNRAARYHLLLFVLFVGLYCIAAFYNFCYYSLWAAAFSFCDFCFVVLLHLKLLLLAALGLPCGKKVRNSRI